MAGMVVESLGRRQETVLVIILTVVDVSNMSLPNTECVPIIDR